MSTLIAVYNSEGCVGRCDSKCYDAVSGPCDCICGGRNHGAGRAQAIANTREIADSWLERFAESRGLPVADVRAELFPAAVQGELL